MSFKSKIFLLLLIPFLMLIGCEQKRARYTSVSDNYELQHIILEKGESHQFDIQEIFKNTGIEIKKYQLQSNDSSIMKISKNKITALDSGQVSLRVNIYEKSSNTYYYAPLARVYLINRATMSEIHTAEQLQSMNQNLSGNYILKSNIDLSSYNNWQPIGTLAYAFKGMFVNPDDYKITGLTISNIYLAGLFGYAENAFISNIILDDVDINTSEYQDQSQNQLLSYAGGIVGVMSSTTIKECRVTGQVVAQGTVGGIAGSNSWGYIFDSSFNGIIQSTSNTDRGDKGTGGIVGWSYTSGLGAGNLSDGRILNCHVTATITSIYPTGGIVGINHGPIDNSAFEGTINGEETTTILIGQNRWW